MGPLLTLLEVPTAIFLCFGTRADVWAVVCFWRPHGSSASSQVHATIAGTSVVLDTTIEMGDGEFLGDDTPEIKKVYPKEC